MADRPRTRRLNVRLLAGTLIVMGVVGVGLHFWNLYQVKRTADAILQRAEALAQEGKLQEAASHLHNYLELNPGDAEATVRLAEVFDRSATDMRQKPRAIELYYRALGLAPPEKQRELRVRLGELLLEVQRFADAESEAKQLLPDPRGQKILAEALYGQFQSKTLEPGRQSNLGDAFTKAVKSNPGDVRLSSRLANLYRKEPQLFAFKDEKAGLQAERAKIADKIMDDMVAASRNDPEARLARYEYRRLFDLPNAKDDLEAVDVALKAKDETKTEDDQKAKRDYARVRLLVAAGDAWQREAERAGVTSEEARGYRETACEHYRKALEVAPTAELVYVRLGQVYVALRRPDEAQRAWQDGLAKCGEESFVLNLCLADEFVRRGELAKAEQTLGLLDESAQRVSAALPPAARASRIMLANLARVRYLVSKRDPEAISAAISLLEQITADPGIRSVPAQGVEAFLLLAEAHAATGKWDLAYEAAGQAASLQPGAERAQLAAARTAARAGQVDRAIQRYQQAPATGYSAEDWLTLARLRLDQAVEAARRVVASQPKDPGAHIRLGVLLQNANQPKEAEAALRKAVEAAPENELGYRVLLDFYVGTKQADRAKEMLNKELVKNEKLPKFPRALVIAHGYELLRDPKQADAAYQEAQRVAPARTEDQVRLADALLARDPQSAEKALRRALELDPKSAQAISRLVNLLATRGGEEQWQEAQKLVADFRGATGSDAGLDERAQARLLALRGGKENIAKARQKMEALARGPKPLSDDDHALLVRLCEMDGDVDAAAKHYDVLVGQANPRPALVASYVDFLLRHNRTAQAAKWLEKLPPEDVGTVARRARLLASQGKTAEIEPLVEGLAKKLSEKLGKKDERADAQLALSVGNLYTAVGQHQAAERWYRQLAKLPPGTYEPLTRSLVQQGRVGEAIKVCQDAAKSDSSPRPAIAAASALLAASGLKPEDYQPAEPLLSKALNDHKDHVGLLLAVANVRVTQPKADEACSLYRRILQIDPKHLIALNNLAALLSEQPNQQEEAKKYIDQAIQIAGPQPGLLDTKAMALVYGGKAGEAVPLLKKASSIPDPDPRYLFHLAVAHHRLGQAKEAREALESAHGRDLTRQVLTEMDRKVLAELDRELRPAKGNSRGTKP